MLLLKEAPEKALSQPNSKESPFGEGGRFYEKMGMSRMRLRP